MPILQLQYGVNAFAERVYRDYQPLKSTANYPHPEAAELKKAIAGYVGCDEPMVLCASGSDELLDLYIRIHKMQIPNVKMAFSPPTYPQYEVYGRRSGATLIYLPHHRHAITAGVVRRLGGQPEDTIVMLDSPSNPSGETISRQQFIGLLDAGFSVFSDEAYYEFGGASMVDLIARYPEQLVVSRSFSKFAGMAGNRIGYLVATPAIIRQFREHQLFFNVNSEGQHRALYALARVDDFHKAIARMRLVQQRVIQDIRALHSYEVFASLDIYAIFKHKRLPTEELCRLLLEQHAIQTMRFPNFKGHDVIRAVVLEGSVMQRLTTALRALA